MCFTIKKIILLADNQPTGGVVPNYEDSGTDVIVIINEEDDNDKKINSTYAASFISFIHIHRLNEQHLKNGDFLNGSYYHIKNMVLINKCNHKNIEMVVEDLIKEGNFFDVFRRL